MGKYGQFAGGMPNMANLMKQAQKMQQDMQKKQEEAKEKEFVGIAGGSAVKVTVSGDKIVKKVEIKEDVVDPKDTEMLQDLIIVAVNDALSQADEDMKDGLGALNGLM